MKAIVIVFMPPRNGQVPSEALVSAAPDRSSKPRPNSADANANRPQLSNGDQTTAPFWTWFVENPRLCNA